MFDVRDSAVPSSFHGAVGGFVELVGTVPAGRLAEPALGTWTLAGASPPGSDARRKRDESIAERGKKAGAALGVDPATAVRALAERVTALVDATEDETPMATAAGRMTLVGYLPTRTFELVVHSLDLAGALDLSVPPTLGPAIAASTALAGEIAAARPDAPLVLLAPCGRRNLPATFSVA